MSQDRREVELIIAAETTGGDGVRTLATQIEELAQQGGEAAPQFQRLAEELRKIEQQQALITSFARLKTETGDAARALEAAQQKAQALGRELATTENPSRKLTAEFNRAKREVAQAKEALDTKRLALQNVRGEMNQAGIGTRNLAQTQAQLKQAAADTAQEFIRVQGQYINSRDGITEYGAAAQKAAEHVDGLGDTTQDLGARLTAAKTQVLAAAATLTAIGVAIGGAAKESAEFGQRMAEVSTLLDDTSGLDDLAESVRRLSREYGGDASTNARALYDIISAGASDAASATDILTAANKLAVGGVTDVSTAADGLTSILNAYGSEAGGAQQVSDQLFTAMKGGKTTIEQLSGSLGQVAPIAATAGVGLDELLAATAAITTGGVKTSQAVTQIRGAITAVIKPSAEAAALAEELGLKFDAAALKTQGLAGFLEEVRQKTGGNTEAMAKLFGGVEGLNAVLSLTGNQAEKFGQILDGMGNSAGATEEAVGKMMDTPAARASRFGAAMQDMRLSLGDAVTAFSPLLEALTSTLNLFNGAPGPVKTTIAAVAGIAIAVPPVVGALRSLTTAWGVLSGASLTAAGSATAAARANTAAGTAAAGAVPGVNALAVAKIRLAAASQGVTKSAALMNGVLRAIPLLSLAAVAVDVGASFVALKREIDATREASASLAETEQRVANRLREISESTGVAVTSMAEFNQAVKDGRLVFDQATTSWRAGETALHDVRSAADQIGVATNALAAAMQADFDAGRIAARALADELLAAAGQGDEAAKAVGNLIAAVDLASPAAVAALSDAIAIVRGESEAAAKVVDDELKRAISELSATDLTAFGASLKAAFDAGQIGSIEFARVNDEILTESFKRLGLDAEKALGRITPATADAIAALDGIRATLANTSDDAEARMTALGQAITAAVTRADTIEGLKALRAKLIEMGEAGELAGDAMQRALDEVDQKIRGLEIQLDPVEQAFKRLGITSTAELKRIADQAEADFRTIQQSGTATTRELAQGFTRYAQAAANANEGVVADAVKAEAAMLGLKVETDATGKVIVTAMNAGAKAAEGLKQVVRETAQEMSAMQREAQQTKDTFDRWRQETDQSRQTSGPIASTDFSDLLGRAESVGGTALRARLEAQLRSWIAASNMASVQGTYRPGIGSADDMRKAMQAAIIAAENGQRTNEPTTQNGASRTRGGSQSLGTNPMATATPFGTVQSPSRVVQVNLNVGTRGAIPVFANESDADRLLAALEADARRS